MSSTRDRAVERFRARMARVRRDRSSGAGAMAQTVLRAIGLLIESPLARRHDAWPQLARIVERELRTTQPAVGTLTRWAGAWSGSGRPAPLGSVTTARRWRQREVRRLREEPEGLVRTARRAMPQRARVVTISRSASVRNVLAGLPARQRPEDVVVLESRPGGEGRAMARDLRRLGVSARWVKDAEGPRAVRSADLVLLGADSVLPGGDLVHKVGTRRLVAAARPARRPVVVVAGTSKFVHRSRPPGPLPPLFDRTPGRWIDRIWTERGAQRPRQGHEPARPSGSRSRS